MKLNFETYFYLCEQGFLYVYKYAEMLTNKVFVRLLGSFVKTTFDRSPGTISNFVFKVGVQQDVPVRFTVGQCTN